MNDQQANKLFEQSIALLQKGSAQEALKLLIKLDQNIPSNPGILFFTATAHSMAGNKSRAIQTYERVIRLNPGFIEAYNNIALDLAYIGDNEKAINYLDKALSIRPDFIEALNNKGTCLLALGNFNDAIECFEATLMLKPKDTVAMANLAEIFVQLGQLDTAKSYVDNSLKINPNDYKAHLSLGAIRLANGELNKALEDFLRANELNPKEPDTLAAVGGAYARIGKYSEAKSFFQKALELNPQHGRTRLLLGVLHQELGEYDESIAELSASLEDKRRLSLREYNRALSFLHKGELRSGWTDYSLRWKESGSITSYLTTSKPTWNGQSTNARVFIWGEQGIGDQILFSSLLKEACTHASNLLIRLDNRLIPIFERSFPSLRFIPLETEVFDTDFDFHLPMGDLPRILRPSFKLFKNQSDSFLLADTHLTKSLLSRLKQKCSSKKLLIGISWKTTGKNFTDRNLPIQELLLEITKHTRCEFIDLQYSDTNDDRKKAKDITGISIHHEDLIDNYKDLDGLSSLIMACDLIVTCSNSTAHLAGALGKETYLLVPFSRGRHWYWSHVNENALSMWYPSIRVIPQLIPGDWTAPLKSLGNYISGQRDPRS